MAKPEEMYQCQTVNCSCLYDPDRGDRKGKIPKGPALKNCPPTGVVRCAGQARRCLDHVVGPGSTKAEAVCVESLFEGVRVVVEQAVTRKEEFHE